MARFGSVRLGQPGSAALHPRRTTTAAPRRLEASSERGHLRGTRSLEDPPGEPRKQRPRAPSPPPPIALTCRPALAGVGPHRDAVGPGTARTLAWGVGTARIGSTGRPDTPSPAGPPPFGGPFPRGADARRLGCTQSGPRDPQSHPKRALGIWAFLGTGWWVGRPRRLQTLGQGGDP